MTDWNPQQPFNDLPLLPPTVNLQPVDLETKSVLKLCIVARSQLAELKVACDLIPNPGILIRSLPLLEAQASSEIENIFTTTDRLFRFQADDHNADPATKEALRYTQALRDGYHALKQRPLVTTRLAEQICSTIKATEMRVRKIPGTAIARGSENNVVYTPPVGESILRDKLANWEKFMHTHTELDPLIRLAVGHYQFEAIHPFTDGNGRTGRILNILFLKQQGLLPLPVLYLSRYIINHKADYYKLLRRVTSNRDWQAWCEFMIRGVAETAEWSMAKINSIRKLQQLTTEHIRRNRSTPFSSDLINLLFAQPYTRIEHLIEQRIAARETASKYLKELVAMGVLHEQKHGRDRFFIHHRLMKLLTNDSHDIEPFPPDEQVDKTP